MRLSATFVAVSLIIAVSSCAAPAKAERVLVAFGTSLTQKATWPEQVVEALLPAIPEGLGLHRVAAAGKNSQWGVGQLSRVISAKPDIIIIEFAINDADALDGVPLTNSRKNHLKIIDTLRAAVPDAKIALMTTGPALGMRGLMRPYLHKYYDLYREIALETSVYLIDAYPLWEMALNRSRRSALVPDGLHPTNAATTEIVIPLLTNAVAEILGVK